MKGALTDGGAGGSVREGSPEEVSFKLEPKDLKHARG